MDVPSRPVGPVDDVTIITRWLKYCATNHRKCRKTASELGDFLRDEVVTLPTRVVDVIGTAENGHQPFLLETKGLKGRYLTLSHCWGSVKVTTTTCLTIDLFKERISTHALCQNFRDAILVTQRLGFQYIWIDSLCIIQDRYEDWDIESSQMARIYNLSTLTISAASASSAEEGFLWPRISYEEISAKIPHRDRSGKLNSYYYLAEPVKDFGKEVEDGPLNTRGWTLQERILSRRNVFFGKDQFHWECQEAQWSESTDLIKQEFIDTSSGISALRHIVHLAPDASHSVYTLWYSLVQAYTKRALTNDADILPALSGIVSVFYKRLQVQHSNRYVAGLWTGDLARGLLWKSFGRLPEHQQKVRQPSWSWVSHYGRIEFGREVNSVLAVVDIQDVDVDVKLSGKDQFGRVESAKLTFTGYIKAVPTVTRTGPNFQDENGSQPYVYTNAIMFDEQQQQIGAAVLDESNTALPGLLYCVPIRHDQSGAPLSVRNIDALLLRKVDGGECCYQRVGTAQMGDSKVNDERGKQAPFASPFQVFFYDAPKQRISVI